MRNALVEYDKSSSFARARMLCLKSVRNKSKVMSLCQALDAVFHSMGLDRQKTSSLLRFQFEKTLLF